MNTNILRFPPALKDKYLENLMFYRLEKMNLASVPDFLSTWCRFICMRPLFQNGCMTSFGQLDLFKPTSIFGIYLSDNALKYPANRWCEETANTLYHEMIHIMLYIIGYPKHDEVKISRCAAALAKRQPEVLNIVANLYPGFQISCDKNGRFYHRDLASQYIKHVPYK